MPGILHTLNIARSALFANRLGIDVASNNIANVNTEGYSRQRVNLTTGTPTLTMNGVFGNGVDIESIRRIRDEMLDTQFRQVNHQFGRSDLKEKIYYQVETILQEPAENSIGNLMDDFFAEFSNLGTEPDNLNLRNVLSQKATNLSLAFQSRTARLRDIQKSMRNEADATVRRMNQISRSLSELNRQIAVFESGSISANGLRDERDKLVDQLSEYVQVQSSEDSNGMLTVSMDGQMLVSQTEFRQLSVVEESYSGEINIAVSGATGQNLNIQTGRLKGLLEMHNEKVVNFLDRLDVMAQTLIEEVNRVHQFGSGLPTGMPPTALSGIKFFNGSDAGTISLHDKIKTNVSNIAASIDGSVGNGDVAFTISNLRNQRLLNGRTESIGDYYQTTISQLGTEVQLASTDRRNNDLLRIQIGNQRESESGVSLDEEMTNMIKYQRSLEAASRVVSVIDDLLQTIINM